MTLKIKKKKNLMNIFLIIKKNIKISTGNTKGCKVLIIRKGEKKESNIIKDMQ